MKSNYLKSYPVEIPYRKGSVVIRNGKTVEFQVNRTYSPETQNTRVRRRVIGQVDRLNPAMMYPNEAYFTLVPDNTVPEKIREAFLQDCRARRAKAEARKNPELMAKVFKDTVRQIQENAGGESTEGGDDARNDWSIRNEADYEVMSRMMGGMSRYIEQLAGKAPNEVIDRYKIRLINRVLYEIGACYSDRPPHRYLELLEEPEEVTDENGIKTWKGITYSDAVLMLNMYESIEHYQYYDTYET